MTENEAIEKIIAYSKCLARKVKGIYEDCNNKRCDDCDLCYMQGTTGEHMKAIDITIQALEEVQQYREIGTPEECRAAMERQNTRAAITEKEDTAIVNIDSCRNKAVEAWNRRANDGKID